MTLHVDINPPRVDYPQWRALLSDSGYGTADFYRDAVLEKMINGCSYFVVAHEGYNLLGYARAFTDDIMVTWIAEILVHPERRRQGIGTRMMTELLRVTGHTAVYADALAGTERFNESFGLMKRSALVACSRRPVTG